MAETGAIATVSEPATPADEVATVEDGDGSGGDAPARRRANPFRRLTDHRWFVLTSTLCVGLVLFVGIRAAIDGWLPLGDDGYFALRAYDVLSAHPPLVGTASSAATYSGAPTNHPGPLQFFLLAVPVRVFGVGAGSVVGQALINATAIGATAWLLRRRFGPVAGAIGAVCLFALAWAMGSVLVHEVWGPWAVIMPFALFLVAVGLAAGGDVRVLPVVAVAGSVVLQTHASYVLLVPGLMAFSFAAVLLWAYVDRRRGDDEGSSAKAPRVRWADARRWVAIGLVALFVCWLPPIIQQVRQEPGNFRALWLAAKSDSPATVDLGVGIYVVSGTVALPPWWFPPGFEDTSPAYEWVDPEQGHALGNVAMAILAGLLTAAVYSAVRRRDRLALAALATAIVALLLGLVSVMRAPSYGVWSSTYTRFLWPISIWVWFSLGFAASRAWIDRRAKRAVVTNGGSASGNRRSAARFVMPATALVAVLVGVGFTPSRDNVYFDRTPLQRSIHPLIDAVIAEAREVDGPILVANVATMANFTYSPMIMARFAEDGVDFVVDDAVLARQVGGHRAVSPGHEPVAELWILQNIDPTMGGELIYLGDQMPEAAADEMAQIENDLAGEGRHPGPLRLSSLARQFLRKYTPDDEAEVERRLAAGHYTPTELNELYRMVYAAPLLWADGSEFDLLELQRWNQLDKQRESNSVAVYFVRRDQG